MKVIFGLNAHMSCYKCEHRRRVEETYSGVVSVQYFCWAKAGILTFGTDNINNRCEKYHNKFKEKKL